MQGVHEVWIHLLHQVNEIFVRRIHICIANDGMQIDDII